MENKTKDDECCPKFNPEPWDEKTFDWDKKRFIKEKVRTFMYAPTNFGKVMRKFDEKTREIGATIENGMCLSDHTSKWNMDVYCAVNKEVPGLENVMLSGKFLSKVYEGDFKKTGEWCKDFRKFAKEKNLNVKKWYMWYTTCPKCTKKYGENYVVIIAEVE
jgi:hypothetical protein